MGKLQVVFINYWSIGDGLTTATILPWLEVMQASEQVEKVILCTIERNSPKADAAIPFSKVEHVPLFPINSKCQLLTKVSDFIQFPKAIAALALQKKATVLFAHGAPAGALAYKVWKSIKLPYYVSSFEPHADYMVESGVWSRYGLKYSYQKYWEEQQHTTAAGLMPVTQNYTTRLISEGVPAQKLFTVPCSVDVANFRFDEYKRVQVREELGWQQSVIGIYVGKYGGLYYEEDAFKIYAQCFRLIPSFRLIILTPQPKGEAFAMLGAQDINPEHVLIKQVPHREVTSYLSAADFAFATYKPGASKKYLSPVKTGEYWASGLPVLLTEGVGDDCDIIEQEGGGALFNLRQEGSVERAVYQVLEILKSPQHRQKIPRLGQKYRSPEKLREAFEYFLGASEQEVDL